MLVVDCETALAPCPRSEGEGSETGRVGPADLPTLDDVFEAFEQVVESDRTQPRAC